MTIIKMLTALAIACVFLIVKLILNECRDKYIPYIITVTVIIVLFIVVWAATAAAAPTGLNGIANTTHTPPDIMTSYGFKDNTSYTLGNKIWLSSMLLTQAGDVVTTAHGLNNGCSESNPTAGDNPSTGVLIIGKLIALGIVGYVTEHYMVPAYGTNARNWIYGIITAFSGVVIIHNSKCY